MAPSKSRLVKQTECPWTPLDRDALIGRRVMVEGLVRTVVGTFAEIRGGVTLDAPAHGFTSWNVDELKFL